jgi:AcrR family transcriptional regulator
LIWSEHSYIIGSSTVKIFDVTTPEKAWVRRGRGRPQSFDRQAVLEEAMKLFWESGYEGTSFADLIAAMEISASTYNSFGSKEQLFVEAVQHYLTGPGRERVKKILSGPDDTRTTFELLLEAAAVDFTSPNYPAGCMISLAGTHRPAVGSRYDGQIPSQFRADAGGSLATGVEAGDLAPDTDATELAGFFGTLFRGMAVQARDGSPRTVSWDWRESQCKSGPRSRAKPLVWFYRPRTGRLSSLRNRPSVRTQDKTC